MSETQDETAAANRLVKNYTYGSLTVGLVPIIGLDMVALTALQLKMLRDLAGIYKIDFSSQRGKSAIGALVNGGTLYPISALTRQIPIAGWLATAGSVSLFSGASTYAIGHVFIQHFASGGTFLTFDPQKVKDYYKQQFTQGRREVKQSVAGVQP